MSWGVKILKNLTQKKKMEDEMEEVKGSNETTKK
jgi:hypothetical protein